MTMAFGGLTEGFAFFVGEALEALAGNFVENAIHGGVLVTLEAASRSQF